jgi:FdhD protein
MQFDQVPASYYKYTLRGVERVDGAIIGETRWTLYLNREELVTFMCTPRNLHHLALGFCLNEGLIESLDDVQALRVYEDVDRCYCFAPALGLDETLTMRVCAESVGVVDLRVKKKVSLPARRVLTSGCGGGITFDDLASTYAPLDSSRTAKAEEIFALMRELNQRALLYRAARGVHTSLLLARDGTLVLAEDVGRHNTLDKIRGECLLRGIPTQDGILMTSGRISSEMMTKAVKMGVPVVVSRTSPTWLSRQLAQQWSITAIGYARGNEMNVYTHPERILPAGSTLLEPLSATRVRDAAHTD